jgi:predicted O-methyltransferase YrrM
MIFMDAAKGQYLKFLPDILRLLKPGGILVSDNVLQDGDILESRYAINRRDRTSTPVCAITSTTLNTTPTYAPKYWRLVMGLRLLIK